MVAIIVRKCKLRLCLMVARVAYGHRDCVIRERVALMCTSARRQDVHIQSSDPIISPVNRGSRPRVAD